MRCNLVNYFKKEADIQIRLYDTIIDRFDTGLVMHIIWVIMCVNDFIMPLILYSTIIMHINRVKLNNRSTIQDEWHNKVINMHNNSCNVHN
jgi:hypothetical protein